MDDLVVGLLFVGWLIYPFVFILDDGFTGGVSDPTVPDERCWWVQRGFDLD